jgi:hypothetical protein
MIRFEVYQHNYVRGWTELEIPSGLRWSSSSPCA